MLKIKSGFLLLTALFTFLLLFTGCESRRTIVNGLTEQEANEIWVFLSSRGIDVSKVATAEAAGGGQRKEVLWDIQVRSDQTSEALSLLNQYGLPRRRGQSLLGIFKEGGGLVPSEMQEKVKYQSGLNEQAANTLRKFDGILDAEVQFSFPDEDPLNILKEKQPITASVFIKHNGVLDDPNTHLESKVRRLIASSVTGLDYDNVTVVGARAQMSESQGVFGGADKPFVNIWSIIIAEESMNFFRVLFFSFILTILILSLLLIWILWKIFPVLNTHGGVRSLLSIHPLVMEEKEEEEEEEKEEGEEETESSEDEEEKGPPDEVT